MSRLVAAGCVAAEEEADELLAAHPAAATLKAWVRRRQAGEPLAWITGSIEFCGHPVSVTPGVYVPRLQSQELAERAAGCLPTGGRAVELCAGAGAIAVHLMANDPSASVIAADISKASLMCARRNGVPCLLADLDAGLASASFDVVAAVAPYVPTDEIRFLPADVQRHEPRLALDGGADGLVLVRRIVAGAQRLLRPDGWLLLELGGDQDDLLAEDVRAAGFGPADSWFDE
ncbi:MAG TPA: HemK/PrmC family methyltransferase, partial [Acidimicrobiales bacterium]|nr:HemK/PrmC family methyltransferase [Acidimicrobiales bacterium]